MKKILIIRREIKLIVNMINGKEKKNWLRVIKMPLRKMQLEQ